MYKRQILAIAICFFAFILWVIYLANTGASSIFFDFVRSLPYGDKIGHAGLFGFLTLVAIIGSRFRGFRIGRLNIYLGALLVSLFVIAEEVSQAYIPSRTFDFFDLVADFVGIALAVGLAFIASRYLTDIPSKDIA